MLRTLTTLDGVSGNEGEVRRYILDKIRPYADEITVDTMGNILAYKKGTTPCGKKIAVCAHMDEVGMIVSKITDDGFLKFKTVGGIDERILPTQRVRIGEKKIPGVIGVKAVHLQEKEERKQVIPEKNLYIDIGATSKEDAMACVSLGDYIAFDSPYREFGDCIKAKALDDRVGCMLLIEMIQNRFAPDLYFCFTVQEETGLRGARVLAHRLQADMALIIESTTASDVPFLKPHEVPTRLGEGPVISLRDRGSISNPDWNRFLFELAEKYELRYQLKQTSFGANDAGSFAASGGSCRTVAISTPCRYIHSPVSLTMKRDIADARKLVQCALEHLHEFLRTQDGRSV